MKSFKLRNFISLALLVVGLVVAYTGLIMLFTPHGRIAYWNDWSFWGLSKTQYGDLHTVSTLFFLVLAIIHTIYNWKPLVAYMKNKAKSVVGMSGEIGLSLVLGLVVVLCTYFKIPPVYTLVEISDRMKESWGGSDKEPPYGHAESSSIAFLCKRTGMDVNEVLSTLKKKQVIFDNEKETLLSIARKNGLTPSQVFGLMQEKKSGAVNSKKAPTSGLGRMTLKELCERMGVPEEKALKKLSDKNIGADSLSTLKKIGEKNNLSPQEIAAILEE